MLRILLCKALLKMMYMIQNPMIQPVELADGPAHRLHGWICQ